MADFKKKLQVWKCDETSDYKKINHVQLDQNVGEILPLKFGNLSLVFLSLANGCLKVLRFNQDTDEIILMPDNIWQDEDYLPPTSLRVVNDDLFKNRACRLLFVKGAYVVLSRLDLSHPGLDAIKVYEQQCVEVCHQKIVTIQAMNPRRSISTALISIVALN